MLHAAAGIDAPIKMAKVKSVRHIPLFISESYLKLVRALTLELSGAGGVRLERNVRAQLRHCEVGLFAHQGHDRQPRKYPASAGRAVPTDRVS